MTQDKLTVDDFTLLDDGTLDTVVLLPDGKTEWRCGDSSYYRDRDTGTLDFDLFIEEVVIPDVENDFDFWED